MCLGTNGQKYTMPYETVTKHHAGKHHVKCYSLQNKITHHQFSKCSTKKKVEGQRHLLQGIEHGWHPTHRK